VSATSPLLAKRFSLRCGQSRRDAINATTPWDTLSFVDFRRSRHCDTVLQKFPQRPIGAAAILVALPPVVDDGISRWLVAWQSASR
jgi:hypothetical protein